MRKRQEKTIAETYGAGREWLESSSSSRPGLESECDEGRRRARDMCPSWIDKALLLAWVGGVFFFFFFFSSVVPKYISARLNNALHWRYPGTDGK